MPERYYDATRDGAPEEDDARYASAHYYTASAMPPLPPPPAPQDEDGDEDEDEDEPDEDEDEDEEDLGPPVFFPNFQIAPPVGEASGGGSNGGYAPLRASASAHPVPAPVSRRRRYVASTPLSAPSYTWPDTDLIEVPPGVFRIRTYPWSDPSSKTYAITKEWYHIFFRDAFGRRLNILQPIYQLPVDDEEIKRQEFFHKVMYMAMGDTNHVGPIEEVLSAPSHRRRRVLDIGCGGGLWAIEIADEFVEADVVGVDLAPIQPEYVPQNCRFELFDAQRNPYPDEYFDVVHCRCVLTGIRDYPFFLEEVARVLAPGGLIILVEPEISALTEGKRLIEPGLLGGAAGWYAFLKQYECSLAGFGIDTSVPTRLRILLSATTAFSDIVAQEATLPIDLWPEDDRLRTIAQYTWKEHDSFLLAARPLFLQYGLSEDRVKILLEDAQQDLYHPMTKLYSCVHVSHARKISTWEAPRRRARRFEY